MSCVLGIDTSSIDLGIGIYDDQVPVASYGRYLRHSHAEHISQAAALLISTSGHTPLQFNHLAVSIGPGSFTGLRIGIAFAKGFCLGRPAKILPLSSLYVLALAYRAHEGQVVTAIDARNGEVFWASFESCNGRLERHTPDTLSSAEVWRDSLCHNDIIITDTMGYAKSTVFDVLRERSRVIPVEHNPVQRGLACAAAGAASLNDEHAWRPPEEIVPNYLRLSAAQVKAGDR
jgi:tRNA threonylcarbamoyladenosine biosynthesis protein TsaB